MGLLHSAARTHAGFDKENVVSFAGLVPVMRLAQDAGLHTLVADRVRLGTSIGINPAGKVATVVAGVVAGADCIDDLDALRHGACARRPLLYIPRRARGSAAMNSEAQPVCVNFPRAESSGVHCRGDQPRRSGGCRTAP